MHAKTFAGKLPHHYTLRNVLGVVVHIFMVSIAMGHFKAVWHFKNTSKMIEGSDDAGAATCVYTSGIWCKVFSVIRIYR